MKLAYFNDYQLGVVRGDSIVDVSDLVRGVPHVGPGDLISRVIERFDEFRSRFEQATGGGVPLSSVRLRAPQPRPGKIVCMVANYLENGYLKQANPINAFLKSHSAVIGDGDTVTLSEQPASIFHHEAEVALIVGRRARHVPEDAAKDYIFGYTNFCDVSSRNLGPSGADTFFQTKSPHTCAPMGPYIVTKDEIPDHQNIHVRLWVDGQPRHDYTTADMGFTIEHTLSWVSSVVTLNPGDIISLGTNHQGIGPVQNGEQVEQEAEGLGRLHFNIYDRLQRNWPVGVDQTMADRVAGRR